MTTRIEPFKAEHLENMDEETRLRLGLLPGWEEKVKYIGKVGPCYTGFVDDEIVACCGVNILWPGAGEAWAIITPLVYKYPLFFHRAVKTMLNKIMEEYKLKRVQATVITHFSKGDRWVKALGFKKEGLMEKYDSNGESHWLYAKVV